MAAVPPTFKTLVSALRRAEEFDRGQSREERISGYYCRLFVVSRATRTSTGTPQERDFVTSQLEVLEKLSPSLNIAEGEGKQICRQYGITLFNKADEIDRGGFADKGTAKLYYSAGTLFEVMEQFGELDNELQEKKKYSKWRTVEITNAINSGQVPPPPPDAPASSVEVNTTASVKFSAPELTVSATSSQSYASTSSASTPAPAQTFPSFSPAQMSQIPSIAMPTGYAAQPAFQQVRSPAINNADPRVKDSMELALFAVAALKRNELALARERLQEALRRLG